MQSSHASRHDRFAWPAISDLLPRWLARLRWLACPNPPPLSSWQLPHAALHSLPLLCSAPVRPRLCQETWRVGSVLSGF